ncbi:MAG: UTP--glucose-1-phosphate uridylyltransferase GalU [Dichotomicrobium sp.]
MSTSVRKAVFPVAGLGTRFLPATKAIPKEMLPVVDRPLIQHVVDEARAAGIEHTVFVTGRNKHVIEDHFDIQYELEEVLRLRNKTEDLALLNSLRPEPGQSSFTRQQEPLGLGHAVWCARDLIGDQPFALLLPDVLVKTSGAGCLTEMMQVYQRLTAEIGGKINIIAVEKVDPSEVHKYGVVSIGDGADRLWPVTGMVEKPAVEDAPSNLTILGRYILQPEIFDILDDQEAGAGGEIQITDAMLKLMEHQKVFAFEPSGQSYDCGSKFGFLEANIAYALDDADMAGPVREEIRRLARMLD